MTQQEVSDKSKKWLAIGLILALIGVAIALYSINHHIDLMKNGSTNAACNINETLSCDAVVKSEYSEVFGIPLGVWGLGYFLAMVSLTGLSLFNRKYYKDNMLAYSASVLVGIAVSAILGGISYFKLGALCPTCLGVYGVTILQGIVLVAFRSEIPEDKNLNSLGNGISTVLITVAIVVLISRNVLPTHQPTQPGFEGENMTNTDLTLGSKVNEIKVHQSAYSGLGEDYRKGNDQAKVTIIEFADFQCPACQAMGRTLSAVAHEFKEDVLVVFKNYPLDQACNSSITRKMHEHACNIAILARCAGQYGKFWEYHDIAYSNQEGITTDKAKTLAKNVGLTDDQITTCLNDKSIVEKIKEDISIANQMGLNSTPTIYLNGRQMHGNDIGSIRAAINNTLSGN